MSLVSGNPSQPTGFVADALGTEDVVVATRESIEVLVDVKGSCCFTADVVVILGALPNFGRFPPDDRHGAWSAKTERNDMMIVSRQMIVVMMMMSRRDEEGKTAVKAMVNQARVGSGESDTVLLNSMSGNVLGTSNMGPKCEAGI